jgi:hypothetical protein
MEWEERHWKIFEYVDKQESADKAVGMGEITSWVELNSVPQHRVEIVLEEAVDDLVNSGFLKLAGNGWLRIRAYPDEYEV